MSIWYLMLALLGFYDATSHVYYYLVLIMTGVSNAFLLPTFITINANWFPIATRGLLASKWQSCNNIGNMVGASVAAKMLDSLHGQWQWLIVIASAVALIFSIIIYFFLNPKPSDIGLKV